MSRAVVEKSRWEQPLNWPVSWSTEFIWPIWVGRKANQATRLSCTESPGHHTANYSSAEDALRRAENRFLQGLYASYSLNRDSNSRRSFSARDRRSDLET